MHENTAIYLDRQPTQSARAEAQGQYRRYGGSQASNPVVQEAGTAPNQNEPGVIITLVVAPNRGNNVSL